MNNRATDTRPPVIVITEAIVDDYNLHPLAGWLYIVIVRHINRKQNDAFPSVARLAKLANMSRASVIRYTKVLEAVGLISVTREKSTDGDNDVNHYRLLTDTGVVSHSNYPVSVSNLGGISQQLGVVSESNHNQKNINQRKEEEDARATTPVPFHIANGLGMVTKPKKTVHVETAKAHPIWQAYVRGWGGIEPDLPASTIDTTLDALNELQKGIDAGQYTLTDIETLTRKKLSEPRTKTYLLIYLKSDLPTFVKSEQAFRQREQIITTEGHVPHEFSVNEFVRQVKQ